MNELDFIKYIERFDGILNRGRQQEEQYWAVAHKSFSQCLYHTSYALSYACNMTTDSCFLLARYSRIYDASILLRTVIHGTVKFLHLISTVSNPDLMKATLHEYTEMLVKKQFASNEQSNKKTVREGCYGAGAKTEFIKEHVIKYIDEHKTNPGEGKEINAVHEQWGYKNLSQIVANRCDQWKDLQTRMDGIYSASNDYVHWNATGCFEVCSNLAKCASTSGWGDFVHGCLPLDIMLDLFSLSFVRAKELAIQTRQSFDGLTQIMEDNREWIEGIMALRDATGEKFMHAYDAGNMERK